MYAEVRELLSADDDRLEMRKELLEQPQAIWEKPLPISTEGARSPNARKSDILSGTVTVTYTVSPRGKARIEEIKTEPQEFLNMQRTVQREIGRRIYRPQYEDEGAIRSTPQTLQHEFKYMRRELESLREESAEQQEAAE